MTLNQLVLDSVDCMGVLRDKPTAFSSLNAYAITLTSFGSRKILVPVPDEDSKDRFARGYEQLPKGRRSLVKKIDGNGKILASVKNYLLPLKEQAEQLQNWKETTFVNLSLSTLYHLVLASKYKSSVCDKNLTEILRLVPWMNPISFKIEARFRFSELINMYAAFDAYEIGHLVVKGELDSQKRSLLYEVLKTAEFRTIEAEMGKLGYLRDPRLSLDLICYYAKKLASNNKLKNILKIGTLASGLPGSPIDVSTLGKIANEKWANERFVCPIIDLPITLEYEIFRESLRAVDSEAAPLSGTIMAMKGPRRFLLA